MRALYFCSILGALAAAASAQQPELKLQGPDPSIVKLGDTAELVVRLLQAERGQLLPIDPVDGLEIEASKPGYSEMSSIEGGRIYRHVELRWTVSLRPQREGPFEIRKLRVKVGEQILESGPIKLEAVKDVTGAQFGFLDIVASKEKAFLNEPVTVRLRFGIDREISGKLVTLHPSLKLQARIDAGWISEPAGAVLMKQGAPGGRETVTLAVNQQAVAADYVGTEQKNGRTFQVFEIVRSVIPVRTGSIELSAPLLHFRYAKRVEDDFFGGRVARGGTESAYVYGTAKSVEVLPLPEQGRPAGFSGGVGVFRVTASASPTELKVGESLKLRLSIEGEGNLEFLESPKVDGLEGFHTFGKIEEKSPTQRTVIYDISPLSDSVKEIPPIRFSYFDPTPPGSYKTAETPPIRLKVNPLPPGGALAPLSGEDGKRAIAGVDDILDMKSHSGLGPWQPPAAPSVGAATAILTAPWLLAGAAFVILRKREDDLANPERVRARGAAAAFRAANAAPGADATEAFATYLAAKLACAPAAVVSPDLAQRLAARGIDAQLAQRAADALDRAVASRYAGGAAGAAAGGDFGALVAELEPQFDRSVPK